MWVIDVDKVSAQGGTIVDHLFGINYTRPTGFVGTDALNYTIEDNGGLQDSALITIQVTAPDVLLSDTFTGTTFGFLNDRPVEVGGVNWIANEAARLANGTIWDQAAIGGVPVSPAQRGSQTLTLRADIKPDDSDWVGTGFAASATAAYWSGGKFWTLLRPTGRFSILANGANLLTGDIPGTSSNGFHQVEISYVTDTRLATVSINGTQVLSQILSTAPNIQYAGFHMHGAQEGKSLYDNFELEVASGPVVKTATDSFTAAGSLNGRTTETGNLQWVARSAAVVAGGNLRDRAAIGNVPFDPSTHGGDRSLILSGDLDPTSSRWVGLGFTNATNLSFWAAGRLWVNVKPNGKYSILANGAQLANGTIPGTPTNGFHHAEIRYNTQTRGATVLLNGVQVLSQTLATAPDIQYAGFHMHDATEGGGKIDNFEVRSVALP